MPRRALYPANLITMSPLKLMITNEKKINSKKESELYKYNKK